jgi:FkbM family methyltransferase
MGSAMEQTGMKRRYTRGAIRRVRRLMRKLKSVVMDTTIVRTPQGTFVVRTHKNDHISDVLYADRQFELELMKISMEFLRSTGRHPPRGQGVVLDVGANIGVISIGMIVMGEVHSAIAVEADPDNFALLSKNIALNGIEDRLSAFNFAASDRPAELEFELTDGNCGDNRVRRVILGHSRDPDFFAESKRRTIMVPGTRLDTLEEAVGADLWNRISLVWVDIQGSEGSAFLGAERLLFRDIPVMCEVWPYGLLRAGVSNARFCEIAGRFWTRYWSFDGQKPVEYPITALSKLFEKHETGVGFENVIFSK